MNSELNSARNFPYELKRRVSQRFNFKLTEEVHDDFGKYFILPETYTIKLRNGELRTYKLSILQRIFVMFLYLFCW